MRKIALAILCVGLGALGTYCEVNHIEATGFWIGCVVSFLCVV